MQLERLLKLWDDGVQQVIENSKSLGAVELVLDEVARMEKEDEEAHELLAATALGLVSS